jgi:hypothetical protein
MQQIPIIPPESQIAAITSSGLLRACGFGSSAAQTVWLATTGLADAFAASRLVRHPEWAQSGITPTRFISAIAARPKSLSPASLVSPHPSPIMLRRWYVRCIIRIPS